jgi:site-specific recombinase XerD
MGSQASMSIIVEDRAILQPVVELVIDGLSSEHSKAAYRHALNGFLTWYLADGRTRLDRAAVQAFKAHLQGLGLAPSSVNLQLSAVRKLATEAAYNGLIDGALAVAISKVKGVKTAGQRAGNWLTKRQAQDLLNLPDTGALKGLRDRAILAVMLGCGLRRSEVAGLTFAHIGQREGRWVVVDLLGKGQRTRSVPMPAWCKSALDQWAERAQIVDGRLFRSIRRGDHLGGLGMTDQAIADVVRAYAGELGPAGLHLAAHDLRRTFAKLAHKGGSPIDQIQLSLGHASIITTERYLGVKQDLDNAPCDHVGLTIAG